VKKRFYFLTKIWVLPIESEQQFGILEMGLIFGCCVNIKVDGLAKRPNESFGAKQG